MFTLRIPKTFVIEAGNNPIRTSIMADGKVFPLNIDMDGDGREEDYYYTEPLFLDNTRQISYTIETKSDIQIPSISIIGLDTYAHKSHMAFGIENAEAWTNNAGPNIIKRADWGADETLRYRDNPIWKKAFDAIEADKDKPKSEATLKYEAKIRSIAIHLATDFPDQDKAIETIRSEGDRTLVWPIEKTRQVERIVIHHTAENNQTSKDDLALIRGIYYYHTIVRGWGDIGYNYLVGQRGQIYEGRAGGDYNVAAHAIWNNKSSVGVSVMGNFTTDSVVAEQEEAIKSIVEYLSKKYGIDIHKTSVGHKECKKDDCVMDDFSTPNLAGHKEVGFTSCPGDNLFAIVENLRKTESASLGRTLVLSPNYHSVKIASIGPADSLTTKPLGKWPIVRIRLSYTGSTIRLKSGDSRLARLTIGANSWILKKNPELPFEVSASGKIALVVGKKKYPFSQVALEANIIEIPSWNRKPSWDKTGLMNDNVFRGKIILENVWGNLIVINELPLEDYLKWIAEVSNGDNEEKIKTILTAARSYAYFYSKKENRKFPGASYDGSDNPDEFQKYLGYGYEKRSPQSVQLVDATNGQIITHEGQSIKPWYFSESNGQTLSAKQYCENRVKNGTLPVSTICKDIPYLQSVTDPGGVGHAQKWHGVGISGIGATYLARDMGFKYDQIIEYYLDGVKIRKEY